MRVPGIAPVLDHAEVHAAYLPRPGIDRLQMAGNVADQIRRHKHENPADHIHDKLVDSLVAHVRAVVADPAQQPEDPAWTPPQRIVWRSAAEHRGQVPLSPERKLEVIADRSVHPTVKAMAYVNAGRWVVSCFAGEEKFLTPDGPKTFAETAGTIQTVLTTAQNGGVWVPAPITERGVQQLYALNLVRSKRHRTIYTTAEHRWLVRSRADPLRRDMHSVLTKDLVAGQRLASLMPCSLSRGKGLRPSQFGIARGFTFGDGARYALGSQVTLYAEKDAALLKYFSESHTYEISGRDALRVVDLPAYFKVLPSLDESPSYLYGWLAGYFAADGHVTKKGQAVLYSARLEHLQFVERLALRLGLGTYPIISRTRKGIKGVWSEIHSIGFVRSRLTPEFFLIAEHRRRYDHWASVQNAEVIDYEVESVEATDRYEPVYCATVPGTESFVLDGYIHTGNCPFPGCNSAQMASFTDRRFFCCDCANAAVGGQWVEVVWPANHTEVENWVASRPFDVRHWFPGETAEDIRWQDDEAMGRGFAPGPTGGKPGESVATHVARERKANPRLGRKAKV